MDIYGKLRELCEQKSVTIAELEKSLDIGHRTFYNWKTGSSPSVDKLKAVADYFGVTVNDFLYDQEENKKPQAANMNCLRIKTRKSLIRLSGVLLSLKETSNNNPNYQLLFFC